MNKPFITGSFVQDIKSIIGQARVQAVRSVEFHRVQMYWKLGERIFVEEQQGKERADYGAYLIRNLAQELEPEFGSGFSIRQLERSRLFYRTFPIASALRTQLNWTQYMSSLLLQNGSTPLGSQVCRTERRLQTGDSGGVQQLRETEGVGRRNSNTVGGSWI